MAWTDEEFKAEFRRRAYWLQVEPRTETVTVYDRVKE